MPIRVLETRKSTRVGSKFSGGRSFHAPPRSIRGETIVLFGLASHQHPLQNQPVSRGNSLKKREKKEKGLGNFRRPMEEEKLTGIKGGEGKDGVRVRREPCGQP